MKNKFSLHVKLSILNFRANKSTFLPYFISSALFLAMLNIVFTIGDSFPFDKFGYRTTASMMKFAVVVIFVLAIVTSLYANRNLRRQRSREYGLYSSLGLRKSDIILINIYEYIIISSISLFLASVLGFVFGELLSLFLSALLGLGVLPFAPSLAALGWTFFANFIIFLAVIAENIGFILRLNPIKLLKSDKEAEREPKRRLLLSVLGLICVGTAYFIAINTSPDRPVEAVSDFGYGVILVILGTYLLVIAAFTTLLKYLKSKKTYYKSNNFISISFLMYRLRQNSASLATVTILSTCIIITLACTFSLFYNIVLFSDGIIENDAVVETIFEFPFESGKGLDELSKNYDEAIEFARDLGERYSVGIREKGAVVTRSNIFAKYMIFADRPIEIKLKDGTVETFKSVEIAEIERSPLFLQRSETNRNLGEEEVIVEAGSFFEADTLQIGGKTYRVKKVLKFTFMPFNDREIRINFANPHLAALAAKSLWTGEELTVSAFYSYNFDIRDGELAEKDRGEALDDIEEEIYEAQADKEPNPFFIGSRSFIKESKITDIYDIFGSFLFIGVLISLGFFISTFVILHYKFYYEGLSDGKRYEVMVKVGLTKEESVKSVKKQMRFMFFAPIFLCYIHIFFAGFALKNIFVLVTGYLGNLNIPLYLFIFSAGFGIVYLLMYKICHLSYNFGLNCYNRTGSK